MLQVGMHEAKTNLSELVKLLHKGERICFTNRGEVVAELVMPSQQRKVKAEAIIRKMKKLVKEHPLGTYKELMSWRREGLE